MDPETYIQRVNALADDLRETHTQIVALEARQVETQRQLDALRDAAQRFSAAEWKEVERLNTRRPRPKSTDTSYGRYR